MVSAAVILGGCWVFSAFIIGRRLEVISLRGEKQLNQISLAIYNIGYELGGRKSDTSIPDAQAKPANQ